MRSRRSGAHRPALDETADAELVERSRAGDPDAYGELWRRHYPSGIAVARSVTSSIDADDIVQEAYTRIYRSLQRGNGPTGAFRPYLFTSIRNTAAAWGRTRRETATDEWDAVPDPTSEEQAADEALDRGLTHRAFRSLPTRWQEVLWYTEIEQMKPAEVAPLLGMKANAVAQLAVRAREGLRAAWIQAHLQSVADGSDCQWTIERLGAYSRGTLGKRDRGKIDAHLHDCARCAIVAAEAKDVSDRLALVLLPLVLGAGATGYAASLQLGAPVVAVAGMPSAVVQGAVVVGAGAAGGAGATGGAGAAGTGSSAGASTGASSGGGLFAGAGAMAGLVTAGVLVAGTLAVAAIVVPRALTTPAGSTGAEASSALTLPDTSDANVVGKAPDPDNLPSAPEEKKPETPTPPAPRVTPDPAPTPTPEPPVADEPETPSTPIAQHPVVVAPAAPVEDDSDTTTPTEPAAPAAPTPTPTPSETAEPTPTPSETAEPSPAPSQSAEPTPAPSETATPEPTPTPDPGEPALPDGAPTVTNATRSIQPPSDGTPRYARQWVYTLNISIHGETGATARVEWATLPSTKHVDVTFTEHDANVTATLTSTYETDSPFSGDSLVMYYFLDDQRGPSTVESMGDLWDSATDTSSNEATSADNSTASSSAEAARNSRAAQLVQRVLTGRS